MTLIIEAPVRNWYCPNCKKTEQTKEYRPHTRYHTCPKLRYLSAPMLDQGTKAKVVLNEREDYVGDDVPQVDPERGRPIMNITTTRDDGQDAIVFAGLATNR